MSAQRRTLRVKCAIGLLLLISGGIVLSACGGSQPAAREDSATQESTTPTKPPVSTREGTTPRKLPTLNTAQIESALKKNLHGLELPAITGTFSPSGGGSSQPVQIGGGRLTIRSVTCPPSVPQKKGQTLTCRVRTGKGFAMVRLRQLDGTGTRLSFKASGATWSVNGQIKLK